MSELENNFNALNIDNQEILYRKPAYHNAPSQENNVTGQQKLDKQKVYRDYLNMQVTIEIFSFKKIKHMQTIYKIYLLYKNKKKKFYKYLLKQGFGKRQKQSNLNRTSIPLEQAEEQQHPRKPL